MPQGYARVAKVKAAKFQPDRYDFYINPNVIHDGFHTVAARIMVVNQHVAGF
jgi:hypothetical protein